MSHKKVILDVDTGSDDAIAIILAVLSQKLDVVGITVTQGNRPLENCVDNTLRVLDLLHVGEKIPVYPGCAQPMVRNLTPGRNASVKDGGISVQINGVEYSVHPAVFDLPAAHSKPQERHACSYLMETIRSSPEKITLIAVGPPTNVGMAFRMDPSIKNNLEEVVLMGGGVNKGNITPASEANFYHDPEAAKIILDSGVKCRIIGLNATHSAELNLDDADQLSATGTAAGKFVAELIKTRIKALDLIGSGNGYSDAIHDALAVASVIDETVITEMRKEKCDIDIGGGAADGQLIVDQRGYRNIGTATGNTYVAYAADKEKFFNLLYRAVCGRTD